jgi:hypothetical protein
MAVPTPFSNHSLHHPNLAAGMARTKSNRNKIWFKNMKATNFFQIDYNLAIIAPLFASAKSPDF